MSTDLLRRLPGDPDVAVEISRGMEHWRAGEITLTVAGSGAVEVRHRRAGEERRYTGSLDADALGRLAGRLDELGFASLAPARRGQQRDELTVTLALRRGGEAVHRAEIPEGQRDDDPRLAGVLDEYESLVERVTDRDLPYGPAAAPR